MAAITPTQSIPTFTIYRNRQERRRFQIYKEDGKAYALSADPTDNVRFKFWTGIDTESPVLDIATNAATANGSQITIAVTGVEDTTPAEVVIEIEASDASLLTAESYDVELGLVDNTQSGDPFEVIARGRCIVAGSPGGDVDL